MSGDIGVRYRVTSFGNIEIYRNSGWYTATIIEIDRAMDCVNKKSNYDISPELFYVKGLEAIAAKAINTGITIKLECPMEYRNQLIDMMYSQGWNTRSSGPKRLAELEYDMNYYEAEFHKQI